MRSPMNAVNHLQKASFFIPDPWIDSPITGNSFCRRVHRMLRQVVGDNSQGKVTFASKITLLEMILKSCNLLDLGTITKLIFKSPRRKWNRALLLDFLLFKLHLKLTRSTKTDFSSIFLNAGAHIQHHYLLWDQQRTKEAGGNPIVEMFEFYDQIIGKYISLAESGHTVIIATGLSQTPFPKTQYYYRLTDHTRFLKCWV